MVAFRLLSGLKRLRHPINLNQLLADGLKVSVTMSSLLCFVNLVDFQMTIPCVNELFDAGFTALRMGPSGTRSPFIRPHTTAIQSSTVRPHPSRSILIETQRDLRVIHIVSSIE